jgi:hypothetical protein
MMNGIVPDIIGSLLGGCETQCTIAHPFNRSERDKCKEACRQPDITIVQAPPPAAPAAQTAGFDFKSIPTWGWVAAVAGAYMLYNR